MNETLGILEDFNERIEGLEREGRNVAAPNAVVGVGTVDALAFMLPEDYSQPTDWVYVVADGQWYQVQAAAGSGGPAWTPVGGSPTNP